MILSRNHGDPCRAARMQSCGKVPGEELLRLAEFGFFEVLDEMDEAFGLGFEAGKEFGVDEAAGGVEMGVDLGKEDALGIDIGVAIAEDGGELFGGAQGAPDAGGEADETDGAALEALGEFQ